MTAGANISLNIGQHVVLRRDHHSGKRVSGIVTGLSLDVEQGLVVSIGLDAPIVIPAIAGHPEIRIHHQTALPHELTPFDDRDEVMAELLAALKDALSLMDVAGVSDQIVNRMRAAIAKAEGGAS